MSRRFLQARLGVLRRLLVLSALACSLLQERVHFYQSIEHQLRLPQPSLKTRVLLPQSRRFERIGISLADAAVYTPFHTVGDLVGLLDSLEIETATVVGHDFGATVAWNAAMMRPDRFTAVFGVSVPFLPPGGKSFLQQLREAGNADFYMFRQMRTEADHEWAEAATTIPGMLYWTSGFAPGNEQWDPFDPARGLTRPSPVGIPHWADADDVAAAIADFQRTGFHAPLNYYRAIEPFFNLAGAFAGARIRQPSFFLMGKADGLAKVIRVTEQGLRGSLPGLRGFVAIDGVGHWPQLEATNAVNEALLSFLQDVN